MDRKFEDCKKLLDITKLKNEDFGKTVNCLYFSEKMEENLVLLEVPKKMITHILSSETGFFDIRFSGDSLKSYLITEKETFELIEIETSNSVYLADNIDKESSDKEEVKKVFLHSLLGSHIECNLAKMPKLFDFKTQLFSSLLNEVTDTADYSTSPEDLYKTIASSKIEAYIALRRLRAVTLNSEIRLCSSLLMHNVVEEIFNYCDLNGIKYSDGIPYKAALEDVSKIYPSDLVRGLLSIYFYKMQNEGDEILLLPQVIRISQLYGEYLLETISSKFALDDFLKLWQSTVPEGLSTNLNYLISEGRAVCHQISANAKDILTNPKMFSIEILKSEDLPDISEEQRINKLFSIKSDWEEPHLAGYLKDFLNEPDIERKNRISKAMDDGTDYFSDEDLEPDYTKVNGSIALVMTKFCKYDISKTPRKLHLKHQKFV